MNGWSNFYSDFTTNFSSVAILQNPNFALFANFKAKITRNILLRNTVCKIHPPRALARKSTSLFTTFRLMHSRFLILLSKCGKHQVDVASRIRINFTMLCILCMNNTVNSAQASCSLVNIVNAARNSSTANRVWHQIHFNRILNDSYCQSNGMITVWLLVAIRSIVLITSLFHLHTIIIRECESISKSAQPQVTDTCNRSDYQLMLIIWISTQSDQNHFLVHWFHKKNIS